MSCRKPTSPIDLSRHVLNSITSCNYKCFYQYNYGNVTPVNVKNNKTYLQVDYPSQLTTAPVKFNSTEYSVIELRVYSPSLHKFDGVHADAELIIAHGKCQPNEVTGCSPTLFVCIPLFRKSSFNSTISTIIQDGLQQAVNNGEVGTVQSLPRPFNINNILPRSNVKGETVPFYSYKGTAPYGKCQNKTDILLYGKPHGLGISQGAVDALKKVKNTIITYNENRSPMDVFINTAGAISSVTTSSNDIYIDCQPTDEEGNLLVSADENYLQNTSGDPNIEEPGFLESMFGEDETAAIKEYIVGAIFVILMFTIIQDIIFKGQFTSMKVWAKIAVLIFIAVKLGPEPPENAGALVTGFGMSDASDPDAAMQGLGQQGAFGSGGSGILGGVSNSTNNTEDSS